MAVLQSRNFLSGLVSAGCGLALFFRMPFPEENDLLQLVLLQNPYLFYGIKWAYLAMLFTTPYIAASLLFSLAYIFLPREGPAPIGGKLPPYPEAATRNRLFVVVGEVHHAKRPDPSENPCWLIIPDRGLFTGIMVFGAIGSGKTSGVSAVNSSSALCSSAADRPRALMSAISVA